jgi:hypothetical protein
MKSFVVEESFTDLLKKVNGSDFVYVRLPTDDTLNHSADLVFREELSALSNNYHTLNNFSLEHFGFDNAIACLLIKNSRDEILEFYKNQGSLSKEEAVVGVFNTAFQTLMNTETAVKTMFIALMDARRRSRNDLIIKYTDIMTQLLKINCYSEFVSRIEE